MGLGVGNDGAWKGDAERAKAGTCRREDCAGLGSVDVVVAIDFALPFLVLYEDSRFEGKCEILPFLGP